jgi:hypothetical protein
VWPLARTVALNIVRDRARRRLQEISGEVPDLEDCNDVERSSLARMELKRVWSAMTELTPAQRAAVLSGVMVDAGDSIPQTPAQKMLRMRARRKLHL